jgi:ABC-2 type transport system permease protein
VRQATPTTVDVRPVREFLVDNAWVLLAAMRTQSRSMRGSPIAVILGVVQPVVFLVVALKAGQHLSAHATTQVVIGVGLTALWGSTIWSAGGILGGDRDTGALAATVTGVRSPSLVFLGKCLGATVRSTVVIAVSTVTTVLVLGAPVLIRQPGWMLAGLLVVILSGTTLGMLLSCLFLVTRYAAAWAGLLMYPVFIIGGLIVPQDLIPVQLRWLSSLISLRWAAEFLATSAFGQPHWSALRYLTGLTGGYVAAAIVTFRWLLRRARRRGNLEYG